MIRLTITDTGGTGRCFVCDLNIADAPDCDTVGRWLSGEASLDADVAFPCQRLEIESLRRSIAIAATPVSIEVLSRDEDSLHLSCAYTFQHFSDTVETLPDFNRRMYANFREELEPAILCVAGVFDDVPTGFVDEFSTMETQSKLRFMLMLARGLHQIPFENLSRLESGVPFRPGHEAWLHFAAGGGGVCGEKTAALAFLCDVIGLKYRHVLAAADRISANYADDLEAYVNGDAGPPQWIPHHLLQVKIDGDWYCIDATGGTLPLRFLDESDWLPFERGGIRLRLVYRSERLFPRAVSLETGSLLLDIAGFAAPNLIADFIGRQQLGLWIDHDCFLYAVPDWGGLRSLTLQQAAAGRARALGLPPPLIFRDTDLHTVPDDALQDRLENVVEPLYRHLCGFAYTGCMLFVYQPLTEFWQREQISASVCVIAKTIAKSTLLSHPSPRSL